MKKILIIEDDISIAEIEKDYLEANGYQAIICENGKNGLDTAMNNDFDLILLDVMLPDMDGFTICKEVRKKKQMPVLFVTARMEDIDKIKGFGAGADDYIVKPFSFHELILRIGAHISRYETLINMTKTMVSEELIIGKLRLNSSMHTVHIKDEKVNLTNREFELLYFLMQNPGVVFSRDNILNKVWGIDAYVEPNTVAVHINRLREKIESDAANPDYIQTVWGVGYKFTADIAF